MDLMKSLMCIHALIVVNCSVTSTKAFLQNILILIIIIYLFFQ